MKVEDICKIQGLPTKEVEKVLASLQDKGLITGFVPGDPDAELRATKEAAPYINFQAKQ